MCRAREGTRIGHDICRGRCADLAARRGAQHEGDAIRRLLAATPPFAEWRQRDLGLLATAARVVQTGRGAELFAARAPAESIYLVEEGFLALYQPATTSLRPRGGGVASASAAGAPPLPRLRGGGGGTRCECAVAGSVGVAGRGSILGLDVVALPPGAAGAAGRVVHAFGCRAETACRVVVLDRTDVDAIAEMADKVIEELNLTSDETRRTELYKQAQKILADDAVNGFLFELPKIGIWDAKVEGLWENSPIQANDLTQVRWVD